MLHGGWRWRPRRIEQRRRQRGPSTDLDAPPEHDPERHEGHDDDHHLLDPDAGCIGEEDRQREPDDIEREVQHDARDQSAIEVEQTEANRRQDQFDRSRE